MAQPHATRRLHAPSLALLGLLLLPMSLAACRLPLGGTAGQTAASATRAAERAALPAPSRSPATRPSPFATAQPSVRSRPSATASPAVTLTLVAGGFEQPLLVLDPALADGRRFVVEKVGVIKTAVGSGPSAPWRTWLDLRDRAGDDASEQGLLGLALHPRFAANGRLYVDYTDEDGDTVVSELRARPGASGPSPDSERVLLRIAQPASNHNGGHLAFGPDGFLYIASGDGGGGGSERAQQLDNHLGKILRIDVDRRDAGRAYGIPTDNPWATTSGPAAEIWALGLRNPWRFSFDAASGDLYIGDVGGGEWEEIDREPWAAEGGRNYGWPRWEGRETRDEAIGLTSRSPLAVPPILVYPHDDGDCAVTGGLVYQGNALPWLRGAYVFADYCSGRLWAARPDQGERGHWLPQPLLDSDLSVSHVGQDADGELLLCDLTGGGIHRLIPSAATDDRGSAPALGGRPFDSLDLQGRESMTPQP